MSEIAKTQLRGICQCCGREQAVVRGFMSKHGFTIENGWFSGGCTGQHFYPMQKDRAQADRIVRDVRKECEALRATVAALQAGTQRPATARSGTKIEQQGVPYWMWSDEMVTFDEAPRRYQQEALRATIRETEKRAKAGEDFSNVLERLADEYHGRDLKIVTLASPPQILAGEKRKSAGGAVLTVTSVGGSRVYWKNDDGRSGWTSAPVFRRLETV